MKKIIAVLMFLLLLILAGCEEPYEDVPYGHRERDSNYAANGLVYVEAGPITVAFCGNHGLHIHVVSTSSY